ncbi:hypothetical protein BKA70DRAFT_1466912 [Coprinopsis sp. MPI-PUGE-AT-0042]|nr:hypothetical protein BKA70DRAFT_1466912 [Coprinopsis sp. MPI-PUGE-AT-0042]
MKAHASRDKSEAYAIYPLTAIDYQYRHGNVLKGWIVQGQVDIEVVRSTMERLVAKWPLLAGRVELAPWTPERKCRYQLRVPLGQLPSGYEAFGLTAETPDVPLSHYVPAAPAPILSKLPSPRLFASQKRLDVGNLHAYIRHNIPLMHWHLTYFPPSANAKSKKDPDNAGYTAIGLLWSHGVFDGMGGGLILDAFHAELTGQDWKPPPPLSPGLNENPFQTFLDQVWEEDRAAVEAGVVSPGSSYNNTAFLNVPYTLRYLWRCAKEIVFKGSVGWNVSIPENVYTALVGQVRSKLASEQLDDVSVSTGDVVVAWFAQTLLTDGTPRSHKIDIANVVSLRSDWDGAFANYVNNCYTWLPYPIFTVEEILSTPLHKLALKLAQVKHESKKTRRDELAQGYKTLRYSMTHWGLTNPMRVETDGWIAFSNMAISNMAQMDWAPALIESKDEPQGLGKVLYHCQYLTGIPLPVHDHPSIQGKLPNGDLVISCHLNKKRAQKVKAELERLSGITSTSATK